MTQLAGEAIWQMLTDTLHQETQQQALSVDLSAAQLERVNSLGALDFGGSEMEPATSVRLSAEKDDPDDSYGWWTLTGGMYHVQFNEGINLEEGQYAVIRSHQRLLRAGAHMPSFALYESATPLAAWFTASLDGLRIKENARLAEIVVYEHG
jgi:hypothetical protein